MARTRDFDRDIVLDRAMRVFWRNGYEATSIHDLVAATGISRSSMYTTFGGKEDLFLAAVDAYVHRISRERLAFLSAEGSARAAIARYFDALIDFSLGQGYRLGCLLTNSAVELAPKSREVDRKLAEVFDGVEEAFASAIRRGQAEGDIRRDEDPAALARFLVSTVQGLRVLARSRPKEGLLRDVARIALGALAPPVDHDRVRPPAAG